MSLVVQHVSKRYPGDDEPVLALDDVSFGAERGEVIGVVGPNGAGKSTLLQVIAGVVAPTSGRVVRSASVASLLEVGSSFDPDLTGTENLEAGMAIAGLTRDLPQEAAEEIVDFAGLSEVMALPLKHYSDGMVARLACALAVQGRPDVLIVDEALAIGDASFQRKMLERVGALSETGTIVLMTTHSVGLARSAPRCLWLREGSLFRDGPSSEVLEEYEVTAGLGRRFADPAAGRFLDLALVPDRVAVGGRVRVEAHIDVVDSRSELFVRVESRPIQGDEPWMRDLDEPLRMRDLSLVAVSPPYPIGASEAGRVYVEGEIASLPITPTTLEMTAALVDGAGRVHDELSAPLHIEGDPGRPGYLLSVEVR